MSKGLPRPRPRWRKLAISCGALVALYGATEIGLRFFGYNPLLRFEVEEWRQLFVRVSDNPQLVYELTPGASGVGWDCEVEINSSGFRDREFPPEKPPGMRRILAVGDSITFGNMLAVEQSWPKVLEQLLALAEYPYEVLNLGVGGYDTLEEAAFLEQVGFGFDPDLVVVGFCFNDIGTVSLNIADIEGVDQYRSWWYRSRVLLAIRLYINRRELTHGLHSLNEDANYAQRNAGTIATLEGDEPLAELMSQLRELLPTEHEVARNHPVLPWYSSPVHVGRMRFAFEKLVALGKDHDVPVALMMLPYLGEEELVPAYDLAYDIVLHEALRAGMMAVDLRADVRMLGGPSLRLKEIDPIHYSSKAHGMIARRLGNWLVDEGLIEQ